MANAGSDQSTGTGALVTLDGSGSYDADGDLLTFSWSFDSTPPGSSSALSDAAAEKFRAFDYRGGDFLEAEGPEQHSRLRFHPLPGSDLLGENVLKAFNGTEFQRERVS